MANKQIKKIVERGRIYITATFNNTIVTITTEKGDPIVTGSCGMHGFSGTRKSTPYAATTTTEAALKKAIDNFNFQSADIFIKGIGPGREASLRAVKSSKIEINRIIDITPIPHNGVRPPKVRRV
ncbi:30S ribosomal protein S11 [Candidatus Roizmanbacteria bacterium CG_4_10_14_0_2_um_filter_36_35]|uniref:Small ribosomal subunit protein uS11 n=4 Tax=Candidatus Roizmaniibacteriota TaxID=1752723 RepID=A0A2M7BXJ1_9BACT|nr:MAG: 30S ribosomal protein S11 [Candidatus Roizmanbacteria bacterium CG11_big_fil_rev_8_21_14_0_20_35_14]PIV11272.1 MAG: 30S ribosomal protein S11 [Candidatus Roizmanbacteria bacterium CG03_land_8_20_14_0_80_35_26]PIZ67415.1 MAG: 30S ribosomal protein S11 [Candidatus Roizmanbacteria bacterium CG_4_10_14_0_2_um_filter_36_35]PJC32975.1 MAG: 30S ribosomal protein S11 [Candidatus Roizmanbacteria bacterium CG_4_9_14_0_2_um_filter_36_12]PJC80458.1 MAG: 30S ribosomal protein S11 [Candidatus Roizman